MRRNKIALSTTLIALAALLFGALPASADHKPYVHFTKQGDFEDALLDLKDAIINRGLVVDYVGNVDKMLERTSKTVGSVTEKGSASPYLHAKYVQFCSAKLTHESVSANVYNLSICPYVVFAFESKAQPGRIVVGYRRPGVGHSVRSKKAMAKIDKLLEGIVKEVVAE